MKRIAITVALVASAAIVVWLLAVTVFDAPVEPKKEIRAVHDSKAVTRGRKTPPSVPVAGKEMGFKYSRKTAIGKLDLAKASTDDEFSAEEQKVCDAVQDALDAEDLARTRIAAAKAGESSNPKVRQRAVEALSWFAKKSIVELVKFANDPDEDVARAACGAIVQGLEAFDEDESVEKVEIVKTLLSVDGVIDKDSVVMIAGQLRAISDEALVAEAAAQIIAGSKDNTVTEELKDVYRFATGEDFTDSAAAEEWVANKRQENAVPDSSDDTSERDPD